MLNDPENHQNTTKNKITVKDVLLFHPAGDIQLQQKDILGQEL